MLSIITEKNVDAENRNLLKKNLEYFHSITDRTDAFLLNTVNEHATSL